jgi:hypothetical protein
MVLEAGTDFTSSYVLYGLGGIGKTQIALEYTYRHRTEFDIIYWLRADDYDILLASYFELYDKPSMKAIMGIDLGDEKNSETIAQQVKSWFENCQHCGVGRIGPVYTSDRSGFSKVGPG